MMISVLVIFQSLYWIQGVAGGNDVSQPSMLWAKLGQSATMNCSHTKGSSYNRMYWFRQYQGESMELIVYSPTYSTPDFGKFNQSKFSVNKTVAERGFFTVKDVDYNDIAVYLCAVSEHSVITTGQSCSAVCAVVVQKPLDLIKDQNEFAEINCEHNGQDYDRILWYKHSQDTGFTYMGYLNNIFPNLEAEFGVKMKLSGDGRNNGSLTINSLSVSDSAV
ncbi:uncharacterized protein LOC132893715 [Neoarius graeffei]|uniref:uncharacterized protein LOC132893715 n=1 Tax=Neoarius graeffei TaxID=443677 RepID=UPI00298C3F1E|nr:uncharacterized protein LOC132893715 [Neoarius graeffei]